MLSSIKNNKKEESSLETITRLGIYLNAGEPDAVKEATDFFLKLRSLPENTRAQLAKSLPKSAVLYQHRINLSMVKAILLGKEITGEELSEELERCSSPSYVKQRIETIVVMYGKNKAKSILADVIITEINKNSKNYLSLFIEKDMFGLNILIRILKHEMRLVDQILPSLLSEADNYDDFKKLFFYVHRDIDKLIKASPSNDFFGYLIKMSYGSLGMTEYSYGRENNAKYKNYVGGLIAGYEKYKMNPSSLPILNERGLQESLFLNALFYALDNAGTDKEKRKVFETHLIDRGRNQLLEVELFDNYLASLKASDKGQENFALAKQLEDAYLYIVKIMEKGYEAAKHYYYGESHYYTESKTGFTYKKISILMRETYKRLLLGGAEKMVVQGDYNDAIKLLKSACEKRILTDDRTFAGLYKPSVSEFESKIKDLLKRQKENPYGRQKELIVPSKVFKNDGAVFVFWDKPITTREKTSSANQAQAPVAQTIVKATSLPSTSSTGQTQVKVVPAAQAFTKAVSLPPIKPTRFWERENPVKRSLIEFLASSNNTAALLTSFNHYDEDVSLTGHSDSNNVPLLLAACAAICFESSDRLLYRNYLRTSDSNLGRFLNCLFEKEYNIDLLKLQDEHNQLHPIQLIFLGIEIACQKEQPTIFFMDKDEIISILKDTHAAMTTLFKDCGLDQDKAAARVTELKEEAAKLAKQAAEQEKPKRKALAS